MLWLFCHVTRPHRSAVNVQNNTLPIIDFNIPRFLPDCARFSNDLCRGSVMEIILLCLPYAPLNCFISDYRLICWSHWIYKVFTFSWFYFWVHASDKPYAAPLTLFLVGFFLVVFCMRVLAWLLSFLFWILLLLKDRIDTWPDARPC